MTRRQACDITIFCACRNGMQMEVNPMSNYNENPSAFQEFLCTFLELDPNVVNIIHGSGSTNSAILALLSVILVSIAKIGEYTILVYILAGNNLPVRLTAVLPALSLVELAGRTLVNISINRNRHDRQ